MRVIHKERVWQDCQLLSAPADAKVLSVQMQEGYPTVWFVGNPKAFKVPIRTRLIATGQTLTDDDLDGFRFVGTIQNNGFVFHFFVENSA